MTGEGLSGGEGAASVYPQNIAQFNLATVQAAGVRNAEINLQVKRAQYDAVTGEIGTTMLPPAGQEFVIRYRDERQQVQEISHLRWDAAKNRGMDAVAMGAEFVASRIVLSTEGGGAYAVSPDDTTCVDYIQSAEVELRETAATASV